MKEWIPQLLIKEDHRRAQLIQVCYGQLLMRKEWIVKISWPSLSMTRNRFANVLKALIAHCAACMHLVHAFLLATPLSCAVLIELRIIEIIWLAILFREIK